MWGTHFKVLWGLSLSRDHSVGGGEAAVFLPVLISQAKMTLGRHYVACWEAVHALSTACADPEWVK